MKMRKTTEELWKEAKGPTLTDYGEVTLETFRRLCIANERESAEVVAYYRGRNQFGSPVFQTGVLPITEGPLYTHTPDSAAEIESLKTRLASATQEYKWVSWCLDERKAEIARLTSAGAEYQRKYFEISDNLAAANNRIEILKDRVTSLLYCDELKDTKAVNVLRWREEHLDLRKQLTAAQRCKCRKATSWFRLRQRKRCLSLPAKWMQLRTHCSSVFIEQCSP